MSKTKEARLKTLLKAPEWRRLAEAVALEPPEGPKPRLKPWRGQGKGVPLDAVLQDLRR
ncbi:hypothetical protein Mesil_3273 (plasmid) [Allomeiothermus silvanus DSM 9946]|uniref:Uncharacterized protein n=1 Tax=Allomeiothermus silvanus (strain ATCC 700542 / DSM 9946 / NBRC 106475 / NCIMB 13440 / VI-R2) TaxID=526227 RepID=D7BIT1_ALLS1|nr:hypothetical protein [Allomeiothermus silvanus]ADH65087.1 hypothetical protein Mesil_3273 [Allomeiothermus silvanus DSM 9946]